MQLVESPPEPVGDDIVVEKHVAMIHFFIGTDHVLEVVVVVLADILPLRRSSLSASMSGESG
jgi:hypothetical protein